MMSPAMLLLEQTTSSMQRKVRHSGAVEPVGVEAEPEENQKNQVLLKYFSDNLK
jgi:hypothetical protein